MTIRRRSLVLLGIVAALLVVAGAVLLLHPDDVLSVATSPRIRPQPAALFERGGMIRATRHGDLVCFETDPGGERLVFPTGYTASRDLRLRDPAGDFVLEPGSAVGIAFGDARVGTPSACGRGAARAVVRIEALRG